MDRTRDLLLCLHHNPWGGWGSAQLCQCVVDSTRDLLLCSCLHHNPRLDETQYNCASVWWTGPGIYCCVFIITPGWMRLNAICVSVWWTGPRIYCCVAVYIITPGWLILNTICVSVWWTAPGIYCCVAVYIITPGWMRLNTNCVSVWWTRSRIYCCVAVYIITSRWMRLNTNCVSVWWTAPGIYCCVVVYIITSGWMRLNSVLSVCCCSVLWHYYCHGMTESVKVWWKDQSIEDSTSKCLFLLFWPVSCVSLISLIEIWSFCTKLLENYPFA